MDETTDYDPAAIEAEFVESWDKTEAFFSLFPSSSYLSSTGRLITELRDKGCDRNFRAGVALDTFCVSRSLKHGLRDDQPCIVFGAGH